MRKSWWLTIDIGSTLLKVAVVDSRQRCFFAAQAPFTLRPLLLLQRLNQLLRRCEHQLGAAANHLQGVAISGQRSTVVVWDKLGPIGQALSWQDLRTAPALAPLQKYSREISQRTGLLLSPHYSASKLAWRLAKSRRAKQQMQRGQLYWGSLNTYLIWHLTGGAVYAIDPTQAQRTLLMNIRSLKWDRRLFHYFAIPFKNPPKIVATVGDYGALAFAGRQLPIRLSIGDTQAAMAAQPSRCAIQYGSGAFLAYATGDKPLSCDGLLTSIAYQRGKQRRYFLEGTVNSAATLLAWLKTNPTVKWQRSEQRLPLLIPALHGLGAPHWLASRTPELYCKTPARRLSTAALRRSAHLAIALRLREIIDWLEWHGHSCHATIQASGGLLRTAGFAQTQADILQRPLQVGATLQGGAHGMITLLRPSSSAQPKQRRYPPRPTRPPLTAWGRAMRQHQLTFLKTKWFCGQLWQEKLASKTPLWFGHRGAPDQAPENTLASLLKAAALGADGVEFDVRLSADGVPMLMHDRRLDRTTQASGSLADFSHRALSKLEAGAWFDRRYQGEKIPTLHDVLNALPKQLLLYIEIKDEAGNPRLWRNVVACIDRSRAAGRVVIASFHHRLAIQLKAQRPDLCVGVIMGKVAPLSFAALQANPVDLISLHRHWITAERVRQAQQLRKLLFAWTVDERSEQNRLAKYAIDGIVTNRLPAKRRA